MEEIKISLIIPAFNEEKYIGSCLDYAIKNSNGKIFEIIVVDNASTDKTSEIAKKYKGVKVIIENRKGLTLARQRGFLESRGSIIANIDADTRMPSGWTEKIIEEFQKNKELCCLSGPYIYYDISPWKGFLVKAYWLIGILLYKLIGYMMVGGNFAIRRNTLEKMNGFDTKIEFFGEDTNIARRASKFGKIKFDLNFIMYTSGRRLNKTGFLKTAYIYVVEFFSQIIRHKPVRQNYTDIR